MLEIFNTLKPFFEDNYARINVREYARLQGISPPSASKVLKDMRKEGMLNEEAEKRYIYFCANREDSTFAALQRAYYLGRIKDSGLIEYLEKELISPTIVLFGSLAKAEVNAKSDIDLAIFTESERKFDLQDFEKKLKRKIQVFIFRKKESVANKMLLNNILNGFILAGSW